MNSENGEDFSLNLFRYFKPDKAAGLFINFYVSNYKDSSKKEDLDILAEGIASLGLENVLKIQKIIESELERNVKFENYEMAGEIKKAIDFYKKNIIGKILGAEYL